MPTQKKGKWRRRAEITALALGIPASIFGIVMFVSWMMDQNELKQQNRMLTELLNRVFRDQALTRAEQIEGLKPGELYKNVNRILVRIDENDIPDSPKNFDTLHKYVRRHIEAGGDLSGTTLLKMGNVWINRGRIDEAMFYYTAAVDGGRLTGEPAALAIAFHNLAYASFIKKRLKDAEKWCNEAIKVSERNDDSCLLASTWNMMGIVLGERGVPHLRDSAAVLLHRAVTVARLCHDSSLYAQAYANLAVVHLKQHRADSAVSYYLQALPVYQSIEDGGGEGKTYEGLALVYESQDSISQALYCWDKAMHVYRLNGFEEDGNRAHLRLFELKKKIGYYPDLR
ncbi:MAG: tetratricopeptide repeat protein [bacterium]